MFKKTGFEPGKRKGKGKGQNAPSRLGQIDLLNFVFQDKILTGTGLMVSCYDHLSKMSAGLQIPVG